MTAEEPMEEVEEEREGEPGPIVDPFDPENIDVVTRTPNVGSLLSRLASGRLDLEPDFQRKSGIWSDTRKSRLIESLLLKIPLPTMYAAESREGDDGWIVVDGVQRISSIASFVRPGLVPNVAFERLTGLEYLGEYEGKSYAELGSKLQTRVQETEFTLNLIRRGTPEPVMFNIFARINTGGAPLTRQELRHALTPGEGRTLLKTLAESDAFKLATGGRVRTDRMEDREMILRFAAFYLRGVDAYQRPQDFDRFLTESLKILSKSPASKRRTLSNALLGALDTASAIFGEHAFRKSLPGSERRAPINKALFETVTVAIAKQSAAKRKALVSQKSTVLRRFSKLLADSDFLDAITQGTGDVLRVELRHSKVKAAFE